MPTPLSNIVAFVTTKSTPTEAQAAAVSCLQDISNIYSTVGYAMEAIAGRYAKHGGAAILAALPAEVATDFTSTLEAIATLWPALSAQPAPKFPETAVIPEPADPKQPDEV